MVKINTKNIGRKFEVDGRAKFFQGNTIISKVHEDNTIYNRIISIIDAFKSCGGGCNYAFLPPESLHMTMIQGVVDIDRKPELWTKYLPLDAPLSDVDDFFETRYKKVTPLEETNMIFDYIDISNSTILVRFLPDTEKDAANLKRFRDEVSEKLGIRFPDHERYGFHISAAYQLWEHSSEEMTSVKQTRDELERNLIHERPVFRLNQPELTFFTNMFYFHSHKFERG